MKAEPDIVVVPFRGVGSENEEVFGKLKRGNDPPIRDLLTWQEPEIQPRPSKAQGKAGEWISESHDSYKVFMKSQPHVRPFSAFQPKPIDDQEEKPPKSMSPKADEGLPKGQGGENKVSNKRKKEKSPKPEEKASQRQLERLKKLNQTTRWLPNTAFKTYFGKPVFANYGMGNTNPAYGGLLYGDYMKSHNIAPHEGSNNPSTQQVYEIAETKGLQRQAKPQIVPRKCKDEDRLPPEEVDKLKQRSTILPKNKAKVSKEIIKPNLLQEKLFKSEHNSPTGSDTEAQQPDKKEIKQTRSKPQISGKKTQNGEKKAKTGLSEEQVREAKPPTETNEEHPDLQRIEEEKTEPKFDEKSHDASVQAEDCQECLRQGFNKLIRTSYQDMTGKVVVDKNNQIIEPYKYCARCRDCLYSDDVLKPPYSLGEIPAQELNPKNYKTLPPQWTQRIPAAGKLSFRSPAAYHVIFGENQPLGGVN